MFCNTPGKGAKDAKGMEAKKRVLEMIMQWVDEEMLEDLKVRKAPKAKELEVQVVTASRKPKAADEEMGEESGEATEDKYEDEADDEEQDEKEERLKRLFRD